MIETLTLSPTQLDIHRAYIRLWKKTPASQIRVNKICQKTPIARSTFYAYYDNIEQLRNEVEDRLIAGLVKANHSLFVQQVQKIEDLNLVQSTLAYIDTEQEAFQAFLIDQVNVDFIHKWNQATKEQLAKWMKKTEVNFDMKLDIFAAAVVAAITHYLKKPAGSVNQEELNQLIFKVLS